MTNINVHDVTEINLSKIQRNVISGSGREYFARSIKIVTSTGSITITLFSDNNKALTNKRG